MITVDRASFMAWVDSTLLDFKDGKGIVGDNIVHEEAEKAMDWGETIGLTVRGRVVFITIVQMFLFLNVYL